MNKLALICPMTDAKIDDQRPNFQNFPKTFSKDLPMSDDLGIPKKFSYPNFRPLFLHFQRTSFLIFLN